MVLPAHALKAVKVTLKSVSIEEHITPEVQTVFRPYHPMIAVGSLSNTTWNSLLLRYKQYKLG
jgi:hypothetical protein